MHGQVVDEGLCGDGWMGVNWRETMDSERGWGVGCVEGWGGRMVVIERMGGRMKNRVAVDGRVVTETERWMEEQGGGWMKGPCGGWGVQRPWGLWGGGWMDESLRGCCRFPRLPQTHVGGVGNRSLDTWAHSRL